MRHFRQICHFGQVRPFRRLWKQLGASLTSYLNFHQPSVEFLQGLNCFFAVACISGHKWISQLFYDPSNGPTLDIEPTAYCRFARNASAPNIGGELKNSTNRQRDHLVT